MATGGTKPSTDIDGGAPSPEQQVRALYEQAESQTAKALEELVQKPSFGRLLAMSAENVAAMSRIASDVADLVLRNLRIASRADIVRLARQLHRTDDKLERVLQEVEALHDELDGARSAPAGRARSSSAGGRRQRGGRSASGSGGRSGGASGSGGRSGGASGNGEEPKANGR